MGPDSYGRALPIDLPPSQSAYVWGPRKVGKSTFLQARFPGSIFLDLLDSRVRFTLLRRPYALQELLDAARPEELLRPIILDEIQHVPDLLNEVHYLIEKRRLAFILCGSSPRKLRQSQANLLGGRAWRYELFPLIAAEVPDFDLLRALTRGLIPSHYDSPDADRYLEAYLDDYLKEEIAVEALTRNLAAFARFLDVMGIMNGQIINYAKIASDVGVDAKTVRSYFEILADTLIGRFLPPIPEKPGSRKGLVAAPKFYLFDTGVARYLRRVTLSGLEGPEAGHLFETYIAHELFAAISYQRTRQRLHYYRTRSGAEVDFVVELGAVAIEAKLSTNVRNTDLRGLNSFLDEYPGARAIVVCLEPMRRVVTAYGKRVEIMPWKEFCAGLWNGDILGNVKLAGVEHGG